MMKLEVKGKIINFIMAAPKTYEIGYVDSESYLLLTSMKAKGIPHGCAPFPLFNYHAVSKEEEIKVLNHLDHLNNRKTGSDYCKNVELTDRAYIFKSVLTGEVVHVSSRIVIDLLELVLKKLLTLECMFGGMIRKFKPGDLKDIFIAPDYKKRTANKTSWWDKELRIHLPITENTPYPTSLPLGHYLLNK
jgi:hypothetical protein